MLLYLAIGLLLVFQVLFSFRVTGGAALQRRAADECDVDPRDRELLLLIRTKTWLHRLNEAWLGPQEKSGDQHAAPPARGNPDPPGQGTGRSRGGVAAEISHKKTQRAQKGCGRARESVAKNANVAGSVHRLAAATTAGVGFAPHERNRASLRGPALGDRGLPPSAHSPLRDLCTLCGHLPSHGVRRLRSVVAAAVRRWSFCRKRARFSLRSYERGYGRGHGLPLSAI